MNRGLPFIPWFIVIVDGKRVLTTTNEQLAFKRWSVETWMGKKVEVQVV